jgi:hypothetical protein
LDEEGQVVPGSLLGLALVLASLIGIWPAVRRQWSEDRAGSIKTIKFFLAFMAYCVAGAGIVMLLADRASLAPESVANLVALMGFILSWIFYGGFWLVRIVPRYRELPAWVDRIGAVDYSLLALAAGSFFWLLIQ